MMTEHHELHIKREYCVHVEKNGLACQTMYSTKISMRGNHLLERDYMEWGNEIGDMCSVHERTSSPREELFLKNKYRENVMIGVTRCVGTNRLMNHCFIFYVIVIASLIFDKMNIDGKFLSSLLVHADPLERPCIDNDIMEENFDLVVIKLGGSVCTEKGKFETTNEENIRWAAEMVKSVIKERGLSTRYIITHGAGSFGHHTAKEYNLTSKRRPPSNTHEQQLIRGKNVLNEEENHHTMKGLAKTRLSVLKLNHAIVSAFCEEGVNAVGISPFSCGLSAHGGDENGAFSAMMRSISAAVRSNLVPIIHGDACLYGRGAGILSGDTILEKITLSPLFNCNRAIFLTDVDGIYTNDPKVSPNAELIPVVEVNSDGQVLTNVDAGISQHTDVTGGLMGKLLAASAVARSGTEVVMVKCGTHSAKQALHGLQYDHGTLIRLKNDM